MQPSKARFVTACQQTLALGAVLAVLTPAAAVITLDVVHQPPPSASTAPPGGHAAAGLSAYTRETQRKTKVPTAPVKSQVTEYALTASRTVATSGKTATLGRELAARTKIGALGEPTEVLSAPQPVTGYGAVGVTWDPARKVPADLSFEVRTKTDGRWSEWMELEYDEDHAPDPDSQEAVMARPGTDVMLVGKVDRVQVRSHMGSERDPRAALPPAGMRLAVVSPGVAESSRKELPALTPGADEAPATTEGEPAPDPDPETDPDSDGLDLRAATFTPKPEIFSRKQWGANEKLRDKSSLRYFEVHAGFVHHTVNANDYRRSEVPGIVRSIYAYHTQSRGWSDVGYNFLVDKFGRIWEGRAGGVDRPVVGAHTLGYNDDAFAMSAIGNYETKRPTDAVLQAYGALFAWKLSLHGVEASSSKQWVGSRYFPAINGHRDAASTACPGRYLYAKIPQIREYAAQAQKGWAGRELESDLASSPHPDLVVRRKSDGQALIIPTGGLIGVKRAVTVPGLAAEADTHVVSPDLTGDGLGDLLVRATGGEMLVRPGTGTGFGEPVKSLRAFGGRELVTPVGDLNGDGRNDVIARNTRNARLNVYLGTGSGGFDRKRIPGEWAGYDRFAATGDVTGDGHVDLYARDRAGVLWLFPGTGTRTLDAAVKVGSGFGKYSDLSGYGDYTRDGQGDLVVRTEGGPGYVLPGKPGGQLGTALGPVKRVTKGAGLTGADLGGDGVPDLVLRRGDGLAVFVNNGTFDTGAPIETGADIGRATALLNAGDWDRDGFGDVINRTKKGALLLRRGDGKGGLADPVRIARGFGGVRLLAAVGDMTGDGWPDLMGQPRGGAMRLYPGKGLDGLRPSYLAHSAINAGHQVGIGRWDTDGAPDSLFRSGDRLSVYPGNGPGGLTGSKSLDVDVSRYDWVVGVSDVNLHGHPDVIVREKATGDLYLLRATVKGFAPRRFIGEGAEVYDLVG